uniref:Uncharacterized protein n=1 Tax=Candidatus Kentrum sp. LPFa TaxID=2126335 RepID=A0A450XUH5_9GAMM|nr:MAG: hypothetical protein BECKLPF1236A_GA0070988_102222 [Candidatus Kentron sp. LPFa]VFK32925.1 MAG: hypothetical protein BECKLPF1236C_GA0070990_101862 [Candidatus Kentron sp. LPFa]
MSAGFGKLKQNAESLSWQERAFSQDDSVVLPIDYPPNSSQTWTKIAESFFPNELRRDDFTAFHPNIDPLAEKIRSDIPPKLVEDIKSLLETMRAKEKRRRALNAMEKLRGSGNGGLVEALLEERGRERIGHREPASAPRVFSGAERQRAIESMEKLRGSGNGGLMEALLELRGRAAT